MKANMGKLDKTIRILFAIAVVILYLTNTISGTLATTLLILSGVFVLTSMIGFCPLYRIFNFSSNKK